MSVLQLKEIYLTSTHLVIGESLCLMALMMTLLAAVHVIKMASQSMIDSTLVLRGHCKCPTIYTRKTL